nr:hypothetical protein [Tanacetum cinerariifolium]
MNSDDTMNDDTPISVASTVLEGLTPYVVDMTVETKKQNSLEDTTVLGSFPPLSITGTTTVGNAPGKSSYANVTGKSSWKKLIFLYFIYTGGNVIDVVVYVESIRAINERFANTAYGAGEEKTVKKPSQTSQGVLVGLKMGFKAHKEYRPLLVLVVIRRRVRNLLLRKFVDLVTSGQAIIVDKDGNPLKMVEFLGEYDSEDDVASIDNDMAPFMAFKRGFGTQSLLEQWRDLYGNGDYDDDLYDDDMYESQDLSHELQAVCDNLDIRVRGRKKK